VCKSPGAGVARYELALLDDLEGCHLEALWLHAINRKQYPRFFRGRYRLGMSLEMIANPEYPWGKEPPHKLTDSLEILDQCRVTGAGERNIPPDELLPPGLRKELLAAAMAELCACQGQLTLWRLIWETFQHRDERAIRKPYLRLGERQRFQDGCRVAELLVAVRQRLIGQEPGQSRKDPPWTRKLRRSLRKAMHITDIITGDITAIEALLGMSGAGQQKWPPDPYAGKKRWLPWQHRTPSWEAAYNAACLYAALYDACADENEQSEMAEMALRCLDRVVNDRLCEMERPWDWIFTDPDLRCLKKYPRFRDFLDKQKRNDYPEAKPGLDPLQLSGPQRREQAAAEAGSPQPH